MTHKTVGFIGGGRITRIFLTGWKHQGQVPLHVTVSDIHGETLTKLKARFPGIETASGNGVAAARDIVFLAVHPPLMAEAVAGIKDSLKPGALVVSLAPQLGFAKLAELLGGFSRLARVIPNAPSVVNSGFNPVAFAPGLMAADKTEITGLLSPLGECPEVSETKLDAYALLTARGPAFFWFQFHELRESARAAGLTDAEAQTGLERMVAGALRTMAGSGLSADEMKDLIPVRPLANIEEQITEVYRAGFAGVPRKVKP